jgi:hypothetical protein
MLDQSSPGNSTLTIRGVAETASGIHAMAALKWSELTCAAPASPSRNASTRTNSFGSSTLLDHSKKRLPGSARGRGELPDEREPLLRTSPRGWAT